MRRFKTTGAVDCSVELCGPYYIVSCCMETVKAPSVSLSVFYNNINNNNNKVYINYTGASLVNLKRYVLGYGINATYRNVIPMMTKYYIKDLK